MLTFRHIMRCSEKSPPIERARSVLTATLPDAAAQDDSVHNVSGQNESMSARVNSIRSLYRWLNFTFFNLIDAEQNGDVTTSKQPIRIAQFRWYRYFLVLTALLAPIAVSANQQSAERLGDIKQEIRTLNSDQKKQQAKRDELYTQLQAQSRKVSDLNRELRDLESVIQQQDNELRNLRKQMGITELQQKAQVDALYAQIRAAFMNAEPSYLEVLLNQQDITTFSRGSTYFRYFHEARKTQLDELSTTLSRLTSDQKQLLLAQQSLETTLIQQRQQQLALQQESDRRKVTLKQLDTTISSNASRLAALHEEEQNLQRLLNRLSSGQQEPARKPTEKTPVKPEKSTTTATTPPVKPGTPFARLTGSLNWPANGKILASYGSSRNIGTLKWQGIVISTPVGTDVKATAEGRVVFADWFRGFGLLIIVDHGEQYMTLYGNNESLLRRVGDNIKAGDVIAQSGEQGIRGVTGLYFEIRHKGNPTNPTRWLRK